MAKSKAKLKPVGGNILVQPIEEEQVTDSGIVLPDTVSKEKPQKGKIVALGTGKLDEDGEKIPFNVKVGEVVLFKKYGPEEVSVEDEDFLLMEEADILAIIE
jgi:chaperonin GroES